jgi:galactokinase
LTTIRQVPAASPARAAAVAAAFAERHGRRPDGVWAAPGRVNLVGEHTDYNGGLVLPCAIDRTACAAVGRRADDRVTCVSLDRDGEASVRLADLAPGVVTGWPAYVVGVVWALRESGVAVPGLDVVVASDVPVGAGLASSAALEAAVAVAVSELSDRAPTPGSFRTQLAIAARRAETDMVGAPVGIMDQMAALHGRAGRALLLDCRSLDFELVPLRLDDLGLRLAVIDTRVAHANVDGSYAARRQACERAAAALGVPALRDATREAAEDLPDGDARRCARHVVTEIERVRATATALASGDVPALGRLFAASHTSLRVDFRISCAELDVAVGAAVAGGAVAARMTGGGFGGCAVALVPADRYEPMAAAVGRAFRDRGFRAPHTFAVRPSDGAGRIS